jgi:enoyl-CoA hydratase
MDYAYLICDVDNHVAVVTINRPDKLNALNEGVIDELDDCFAELSSLDEVRCIVLTGAGDKAFVAGADITQFADMDVDAADQFARRGQQVFSRIEESAAPVIAAVNGYALGGGCELALACHIRLASENASFGQPEVNLGVIPGYGGTQRLPRTVGRGLALEMILSGDPITAARAFEIGLVNRVTPQADLLATAMKLAGRIASRGPVAVKLARQAVLASDRLLEDGLDEEARLFGKAFATKDVTEGVAAFLERRKPDFSGH